MPGISRRRQSPIAPSPKEVHHVPMATLDLLLLALSGLPAAAAHGGVPISFGSHPHFVRHFNDRDH
jgi:hypothetical protein